ncbi:MAG: hypothetical protein PHE80_07270 [Candidatus Omnitrophica bacterium]|nr:hypothetical protein [Candidatus Omnitrophota bacterium]MDD5736773.1 hypothetical protein [Candidatus Omnitrophota bacterium]
MTIGIIAAVFVAVVGLYSVVFSRSAAIWVLGLDNNIARPDLHEKVYRAGFAVVGFSFIAFGLLTVLLVA